MTVLVRMPSVDTGFICRALIGGEWVRCDSISRGDGAPGPMPATQADPVDLRISHELGITHVNGATWERLHPDMIKIDGISMGPPQKAQP
jgi:hypothetical protein